MTQLEKNVIDSFRLAKSDIIKLQHGYLSLSQAQERMMELIDKLNARQLQLTQQISRISEKKVTIIRAAPRPKVVVQKKVVVKKVNVARKTHTTYLASKHGKTFHITSCPFAQNIMPKHKIVFKTKAKALNHSFKACKCVK